MTFTSEALVSTDRPERYGSQLAKHFANKIDATWEETRGTITFPFGTAELTTEDGGLRMRASATDQESLTRLEDVVGSHLVRFGQRDELKVEWHPAR
ncbi:DUF2218 domain-containing protein [Kibdelosporangium lantanae]|uniref:DUF2218 domain-containing protein n=1 Tax=Kibdelosporangium lantanae TaxID=1497396 RepID=A0ABW3MMK3_9PSEU